MDGEGGIHVTHITSARGHTNCGSTWGGEAPTLCTWCISVLTSKPPTRAVPEVAEALPARMLQVRKDMP